jgi:hypothetical protein
MIISMYIDKKRVKLVPISLKAALVPLIPVITDPGPRNRHLVKVSLIQKVLLRIDLIL